MRIFSSPSFYRKIFLLSFVILPLLVFLATPQGYTYERMLSAGMDIPYKFIIIFDDFIALLIIAILLITLGATLTGLIFALKNKDKSLLALNLKNLIFCGVNSVASGYIFMLILASGG